MSAPGRERGRRRGGGCRVASGRGRVGAVGWCGSAGAVGRDSDASGYGGKARGDIAGGLYSIGGQR